MRRELVIPSQLSGGRIERHHGGSVEIVAFAFVAVVVWTRITSRPVKQFGLGVVGASEPSGAATMLERTARPGFRSRFAGRRNRPEPPNAFAGGGLVGVQKTPDSFISTRNPSNHE